MVVCNRELVQGWLSASDGFDALKISQTLPRYTQAGGTNARPNNMRPSGSVISSGQSSSRELKRLQHELQAMREQVRHMTENGSPISQSYDRDAYELRLLVTWRAGRQ